MREPPLILVVDDVPDNIDILQMRLESQGYDVIAAADGEQALAVVHERLPDLVLLDIMMPGMDGYQTIQEIRSMPRFASLPIVAVTAKAMKGDRQKCIEAGASDYVAKPVRVAAIYATLGKWLEK